VASINKISTGWRVRWRTPEGASRSKTYSTKARAEQKRAEVETDKFRGAYVDSAAGRTTVATYAET
jgi:hypothetical protein